MPEVLESFYEKRTEATHIFEEIFRHGMLGQERVSKKEPRDPIQPVQSIIRPTQTLANESGRTALPSYGRPHKKSQCTLCSWEPGLIPSLADGCGSIPLQVKGQCYDIHEQTKDQRIFNPKRDKIDLSMSNDGFANESTSPSSTSMRQTCTWKEPALSRPVSCEDDDVTHLGIGEQQHQMSMQINGQGFPDLPYLSNWNSDEEDKKFIQAVTLRIKAWHPERDTGTYCKDEADECTKIRTTCKQRRELKKKLCAGGKYDNSVLNSLCETAVHRSRVKNTIGGNRAKVSQLRFPPIQIQRAKPVQELEEIASIKLRRKTKFAKSSSLREKHCQNDGDIKNSFIKKLPLQLHSKSQLCNAKLISPPLPTRLDNKLSLDSSISKKRLELPFRLPQLRVLPSIGSVSIPQLGKSTIRHFKGEVNGYTVINYVRR